MGGYILNPCHVGVLKNSSYESDGAGGDSDACHILEIGKLRPEKEMGSPKVTQQVSGKAGPRTWVLRPEPLFITIDS